MIKPPLAFPLMLFFLQMIASKCYTCTSHWYFKNVGTGAAEGGGLDLFKETLQCKFKKLFFSKGYGLYWLNSVSRGVGGGGAGSYLKHIKKYSWICAWSRKLIKTFHICLSMITKSLVDKILIRPKKKANSSKIKLICSNE